MLTVDYDIRLGIVRLAGKGFYSLADEEMAAQQVKEAAANCKAASGDLKLLIICDAQVQRPEVMEVAAKRCENLIGLRDRAAFVFETSLAKMQASRYFRGTKQKCFISENAAITWLLADRGAARPAAATA